MGHSRRRRSRARAGRVPTTPIRPRQAAARGRFWMPRHTPGPRQAPPMIGGASSTTRKLRWGAPRAARGAVFTLSDVQGERIALVGRVFGARSRRYEQHLRVRSARTPWRNGMATGTVKWFNDDKGFGSSPPTREARTSSSITPASTPTASSRWPRARRSPSTPRPATRGRRRSTSPRCRRLAGAVRCGPAARQVGGSATIDWLRASHGHPARR